MFSVGNIRSPTFISVHFFSAKMTSTLLLKVRVTRCVAPDCDASAICLGASNVRCKCPLQPVNAIAATAAGRKTVTACG